MTITMSITVSILNIKITGLFNISLTTTVSYSNDKISIMPICFTSNLMFGQINNC